MPREVVDKTKEIKAANDIVDVIGSYTSIKKLGSAFKCICPFHNDTNPSLTIDKKHQRYKCWACGAQGDVFTFVEKYERVNFMEARNILAKRAGIALEKASPEDSHKSKLLEVMNWAQRLYADEYLNGQSAERARHYTGTRHISGASARQFGVGYAPSDNGWLERAAAKDGIAQELLIEVGLLGVRDEGGVWDRFRDRVMFPIRDVQGRTIGFGGRILPDSPFAARSPKYYNTAETMLFSKSHTIFGIDLARHAGSAAGYLAVVEGYTDVMMAHQCGVANVVATMGTALNERHIAHLRRYVPKIVLVFDADEAGNSAADRALELFIASDLELSIARLPDGLDPADLLAKDDGVTVFKAALENAVDALDFKLNQLLASGTRSVEGVRHMLDSVLAMLALAPPVPNPSTQMKRELMLTRLAHRLGLELSTVRARLSEFQNKNQSKAAVQTSQHNEPVVVSVETSTIVEIQSQAASNVVLEKQLVQLLLAEPSLVSEAANLIHPNEISHTGLRRILAELFNLHDEGSPADLDGLRIRLLDRPDLASAALTLMDIGRGIPDRPIYLTKIIDGFANCRHKASAKSVKEQLLAVSSDDDAAALALLQRLQSLPK